MSLYDSQGNITRAGAEKVIREGGSVSIKGRLYASIDKLPNDADFAAGDPASEAAARTKLEKQAAEIQAQLAKLGPAGTVTHIKGAAPKGAAHPKGGAEGNAPDAAGKS